MVDTPFLAVRDLRKRYGGVAAVDGMNLTVHRGDFHALMTEAVTPGTITFVADVGEEEQQPRHIGERRSGRRAQPRDVVDDRFRLRLRRRQGRSRW